MKIIRSGIVVFIILLLLLGAAFLYIRQSLNKELSISGPTFYELQSGATLISVANDLENKRIINNAGSLIWLNRFVVGRNHIF